MSCVYCLQASRASLVGYGKAKPTVVHARLLPFDGSPPGCGLQNNPAAKESFKTGQTVIQAADSFCCEVLESAAMRRLVVSRQCIDRLRGPLKIAFSVGRWVAEHGAIGKDYGRRQPNNSHVLQLGVSELNFLVQKLVVVYITRPGSLFPRLDRV
jgi:hypothetical protein